MPSAKDVKAAKTYFDGDANWLEAAAFRHALALVSALSSAEARIKAYELLDAGQTGLLAAYRTGNHRRADSALTKIAKARASLSATTGKE